MTIDVEVEMEEEANDEEFFEQANQDAHECAMDAARRGIEWDMVEEVKNEDEAINITELFQ